jgi:hypothetical protein
VVGHVQEDQEAQGAHASLQGEPRQAPEHGSRLIARTPAPASTGEHIATPPMTSLVELVIGASEVPWQRLGLEVLDGRAVTAGVRLRFTPDEGGLRAWGFSGLPDPDVDTIDGVRTFAADAPEERPDGPLGIVAVDHVVVNTSDLERTCTAIEMVTGAELRRIREAGAVRQGFHRVGQVVIEVVERPEPVGAPTALWGLVWTVSDLDGVCARLGEEVISVPRHAVQPGRRIATVRAEVGLGVPLALMSTR